MDTDITNTVTNSPASEETGSMLLERLNVPIKIFVYSSIQVKVLAAVAAIKFGKPLLTLVGNGPKAISTAFTTLTGAFTGMRKFLFTTAPDAIKRAYRAGTQFFTKAFTCCII